MPYPEASNSAVTWIEGFLSSWMATERRICRDGLWSSWRYSDAVFGFPTGLVAWQLDVKFEWREG